MPENWSHEEVEAAVADYFDMLAKELRGESFNKAEHNRRLQQLLQDRPRGSIERKHQNISAILIELGYPYIDGYKPLGNYQQLLRSVVEDRLSAAAALHQTVATAVEEQVEAVPIVGDILSIQVAPPSRDKTESRLYEKAAASRTPVRRNYLELEARNQSLGHAGEAMVIQFEHERLWRVGQRALADRIEHVSRTRGDHLGYDIHSFETDGRDRLIEVKTTRFGSMTPFFASRNEVGVSETREREYQLYRLFNFREQPKLFVLAGALRNTCELDPASLLSPSSSITQGRVCLRVLVVAGKSTSSNAQPGLEPDVKEAPRSAAITSFAQRLSTRVPSSSSLQRSRSRAVARTPQVEARRGTTGASGWSDTQSRRQPRWRRTFSSE